LEAGLVGFDDLVEACNVLDLAGEHDLHDLARLANDLVAGLVPPLACGVEHGEPLGKRDMISRSTKRPNSPSLTPIRLPMLRPNMSSAIWVGLWPPRQSSNCALAAPVSARASIEAAAMRMNRVG